MLCNTTLRDAMLCYASYAMLSYAMLRYACYATLGYATRCAGPCQLGEVRRSTNVRQRYSRGGGTRFTTLKHIRRLFLIGDVNNFLGGWSSGLRGHVIRDIPLRKERGGQRQEGDTFRFNGKYTSIRSDCAMSPKGLLKGE